jgi:hypothetical protein
MNLKELVQSADGMSMEDEDGDVERLRLSPGLTPSELAELEKTLPCSLPQEVRDLLSFSRGFENGPVESVCFSGLPGGFGLEEVFPSPLPIAHDGFGNYWIVDLNSGSTSWSPILYACHDPPVIVYQTSSLEHFIREILRFANPPHASELDEVHEQAADRIWRHNPGAIPAHELRDASDSTLRAFARSLSDSFFVIDMRSARPGDGFSWGRFGPRTRVVRHGTDLLFGYETKTRWQRLLGR